MYRIEKLFRMAELLHGRAMSWGEARDHLMLAIDLAGVCGEDIAGRKCLEDQVSYCAGEKAHRAIWVFNDIFAPHIPIGI